MLLTKSIQCLRFFETEEPFQQNECSFEKKCKLVEAYEIESLKGYQKHYVEVERMLYGQNERYRDHVFHSFRVWLIGVYVLTIGEENERLIDKLVLDGGAKDVGKINHFEWLSMWTIAALCHDLGYPLELIGSVLDKTNEMMSDFFPRPNVSDNFTFTGIQNVINDHILKFMSTKIEYVGQSKNDNDSSQKENDSSKNGKDYLGEIQQKYYFKYAGSLEENKHGIISAMTVFRMLPFFLETDFNLDNGPCYYEKEEARQFYIRREILRAMASHTCDDIFNVKIQTLPALLFICDELQEWGRKAWKDFYVDTQPSEIKLFIYRFDDEKVNITEKKSISDLKAINEEIKKKLDEFSSYKKIFRDGPGTANREFSFTKKTVIKLPDKNANQKKKELVVAYKILQGKQDEFDVDASKLSSGERRKLKKLVKESSNLDSEERDILEKLLK